MLATGLPFGIFPAQGESRLASLTSRAFPEVNVTAVCSLVLPIVRAAELINVLAEIGAG